jgi:hypothetical protein
MLDQPSKSGPPALYCPEVGDGAVLGIVDVGNYAQRDYDTGDPKTWPDGSPMMGKVVTGLVVSVIGGACGGGKRASAPIATGDLVTIWCEGGKFLAYNAALKAAGGVDRGDLLRWVRLPDGVPSNPRHNPPQAFEAAIRKATAADGDVVARCHAAFADLNATRVDSAPAAGPFDGGDAPW